MMSLCFSRFVLRDFATPAGIDRLKKISWKKLDVWYEVQNDHECNLCQFSVEDTDLLDELQSKFIINKSEWLPLISYTSANRLVLSLENDEVFVLIVGQNSLRDTSSIICYNLRNDVESYGVDIDTNFLLALKEIILKNTEATFVSFPIGALDQDFSMTRKPL